MPCAGSIRRPLMMLMLMPHPEVGLRLHRHRHHRHAHGDAVADLLQDHRSRAVRDLGVHLDAAVHRSRVHHDRVRFGGSRRSSVSPYSGSIVLVGQQRAIHALILQAQHDHHVDVPDAFGEVVEHVRQGRGPRSAAGCVDRRCVPR